MTEHYFEYNFICGVQRHKRWKYDKIILLDRSLSWDGDCTMNLSEARAPLAAACCPHPETQVADHHVWFPCSNPFDHPSVTWPLPLQRGLGDVVFIPNSHTLLQSVYHYRKGKTDIERQLSNSPTEEYRF